MNRYLYLLLLILTPIIIYASPYSDQFKTMDSESCGQSSGTTILGYESTGSNDSIGVNEILCSGYDTIADTCTVDEIVVYLTGHVAGEEATIGVYSISGTTGTKLEDTAALDGDGVNDWETVALDAETETLSASTEYVICVGAKGGDGLAAQTTNTASGWTKSITGESWSSGTLPTTLDFSSSTANWQMSVYGTNP